ncbi:hypothetical protein LJC59_00625 [Desulfovibrio sp. OttesenSCG-928-A18]|nr:hypothetical protein [Desulfovibrio sp. OttesenSCG-928-A18]
MQEPVNGLPVSSVGQRLFDQAAQAAKIAFEAAKFQAGFLMLQAGHDKAKTNELTEGRE